MTKRGARLSNAQQTLNYTKNTMSKKLWTGKTAREEFISIVSNYAAFSSMTVADSLEFAFENLEYASRGSITCEMWNYWNKMSAIGQSRLFNHIKKKVLADDRLMGRRIER